MCVPAGPSTSTKGVEFVPGAGAVQNSASVFPAYRKRRLKGKWPDGAGVWDADTPKPLGTRVLEVLTAT